MKSSKKIKYLFVARGPGETGQARALARYIAGKGGKIVFCLQEEKNLYFLKEDKDFTIYHTKTAKDLKRVIENEKPQALLIFNSKIWDRDFKINPGFKRPLLVFCVDSNWLFNADKYPLFDFVAWADKYLVIFPEKIFNFGLKQNKGNFAIKKETLKKIIPVGFVPSYEKPSLQKIAKLRKSYGIKRNEKFIFSYFSGFGAGHRDFAFYNMVKAIEILIEKKRKIKALYVGPTENINQQKLNSPWLLKKENFCADDFFLTLASSDLVFQHQGMVTLSQAISANVPAICNVQLYKNHCFPSIHFCEVRPFERAGVCKMFPKSTKPEKIAKEIEKLLYDRKVRGEMIKAQQGIAENGEKKSFEIIKKFIAQKIQ